MDSRNGGGPVTTIGRRQSDLKKSFKLAEFSKAFPKFLGIEQEHLHQICPRSSCTSTASSFWNSFPPSKSAPFPKVNSIHNFFHFRDSKSCTSASDAATAKYVVYLKNTCILGEPICNSGNLLPTVTYWFYS